MLQLQQEVEHLIRQESNASKQELVFAACHWWQLWEPVGALVLLLAHCWLARKPARGSQSSSQLSTSGSKEEEKEEERLEHWPPGSFLQQHLQWPPQDSTNTSKVVEELVGDLLSACRVLTFRSFFPRLAPSIHMRRACPGCNPCQHNTYSLLVPLRPPPGHAFHLEVASTRQQAPGHGRVRVQLQCMCARQRLLGDVLCFLHQPQAQLATKQGSCLLRTLCTRSYLNVQKTACWFQQVVQKAWHLLPPSHHCQLVVLPSSRACKLRLANASGSSLLIHIIFGVQQGNLGIFWPASGATPASSEVQHCWRSALGHTRSCGGAGPRRADAPSSGCTVSPLSSTDRCFPPSA
ncbi:inositol 1,4,5-trisphosphate receptor-interacting protein-like 1 [Rhea pennata]